METKGEALRKYGMTTELREGQVFLRSFSLDDPDFGTIDIEAGRFDPHPGLDDAILRDCSAYAALWLEASALVRAVREAAYREVGLVDSATGVAPAGFAGMRAADDAGTVVWFTDGREYRLGAEPSVVRRALFASQRAFHDWSSLPLTAPPPPSSPR